jgi:hypothetical protein
VEKKNNIQKKNANASHKSLLWLAWCTSKDNIKADSKNIWSVASSNVTEGL